MENQEALIYIPDISGFTTFVNATAVEHSRHIISELLEIIIDCNDLSMTVSEIEGDAVLFFREGPPPTVEELKAQTEATFLAFHTHLKRYESQRLCQCGACSSASSLTLKTIAHYGEIGFINVKGGHKPHGSSVILAHRLMKNEVPTNEYLLITDGLSTGKSDKNTASTSWPSSESGSESYENFGEVNYEYFVLSSLHDKVPEAPFPPLPEKTENPIRAEIFIDRPLEEVYDLVTNFDRRMDWNKGIDKLYYEEERVNRVGSQHQCLINGKIFNFDTVTNDFGPRKRVYGERVAKAPIVKSFSTYYVMESEKGGTRVKMENHYIPRPFIGRLTALLFRKVFGKNMRSGLNQLKGLAESSQATA